MSTTPKVYAICDANCRWETLSREQILTAIAQAANEGIIRDVDTGFVQTIKTINGHGLKFFVGEQSEYDTLTKADKEDLFAIITNDSTKEGLFNAIRLLEADVDGLNSKFEQQSTELASGYFVVGKAKGISNEWVDVSGSNTSSISGIEAGLYVVVVDVNPSETTKHRYFTCVIWCDAINNGIGSTAIDASYTVSVQYTSATGSLWAQALNTNGGGVTSDSYKIAKYKKLC